MTVFPSSPTLNQQVVFNSITYQWNSSRWVSLGDSAVTPIARGGTGSATAPMIGVVTAADAAAAQSVLGGTTVGKAVFVAADAAAARTAIGAGTGAGDLVASNNLSDVANAATARGNLGAGTGNGDLLASNNLSEVTASAARTNLGSTTVGDAVFVAADAAAARTAIGVTNIGSYTGQIETVADKTYTLDPSTATARTITGFYIRSASGTVTATLKNGTATVDAAPVTNTSGNRNPGAFANTSVLINGLITIVTSSNSSALDVIFAVEYTE
tara:strand:- start:3344 stop:4156 length:813 start_codon:yes stop_codon:yes gene_type:complete